MEPKSKTKRVLVVDDAPSLRDLLARTLQDAGYEVDTAEDGEEGLEKFRGNEWDLVITDLQMPRMNGEALAAAIRADDPTFPIIMVTGSPEAVRDPEAYYRFVEKPFRGRDMVQMVESAPMRQRCSASK